MTNENPNTEIKELAPYILLQPYRDTITIGKDTVKILGFPKHVCLRINEQTNSFAIIPCEPEAQLSFKVPDKLFTNHHCVFRLRSKQFMTNIILKNNLDPNLVYTCKGIYSKKVNAVIVSLNAENLQVLNAVMPSENV